MDSIREACDHLVEMIKRDAMMSVAQALGASNGELAPAARAKRRNPRRLGLKNGRVSSGTRKRFAGWSPGSRGKIPAGTPEPQLIAHAKILAKRPSNADHPLVLKYAKVK